MKVWFQNRRTKYKRLKAEEAETRGGKEASDDTEADHVMLDDSREEEEEDMEDMIEAEEEEEEEAEELERRRDIDSEGQIRVVSPSNADMASASSTTQITDATRKASHHLNRWRVETNLVWRHSERQLPGNRTISVFPEHWKWKHIPFCACARDIYRPT